MEFSINHPILYVLVGVIILAVLGQSVYFLLKSVRQAKKCVDGNVIGAIENCYANVDVTSEMFAGGLVGTFAAIQEGHYIRTGRAVE